MISGLERVTAKRVWFVPDFEVWGLPPSGEHDYLAVEMIDGALSIYFDRCHLGEADQEVIFASLIDHRGNHLPEDIKSPRVIPRPSNSQPAFIVGRETSHSFTIARDSSSGSTVTVDLLIVEMGD